MKRQAYQHPELRDADNNIIQEGTYGKESPLVNGDNTGVLDYINNNLEALHDNINGSRIYVANKDTLPAMGDLSAMYIAEDTGKWYLWDGSKYIETDNARKIADEAIAARDAAKASQTAAKTSEQNAKTSETNAAASEQAAATSAGAAKTSEQNAGTQANTAKAWATATTSPDGAADTASSTGKTQSAKSWALYSKDRATASATSANASAKSATAAKGSEDKAKASEVAATESESKAKASEDNAKQSELNAATSANTATTQASNASQSASSASASASTATTKATDASNSASEASTYAANAATSATKAKISETSASNSAIAAAKSAQLVGTFDPSNYPLKQYTLDLSALDVNTFYPVIFAERNQSIEAEIHSKSVTDGDPYNQNALSFRVFASGWQDGPRHNLTIKDYYVYDKKEITIGCIATGTHNGYCCVWLRGGRPSPYRIISTVEPKLFATGWSEFSGQVATIGPTYHGAETGNTYMEILFSPLDIPSDSAKNFDYTTYGTFEKAIKDSDDNTIKDTYATKADIANSITTKTLTVSGESSVPTANEGNSSKAIANTEFVAKSLASLVNGAPDQLNTLNELAEALGNDANFAATITAELAKKLNSAEAESTYATKTEARVLPGTVTAFSGTFNDGYPIDKNTGLVNKEWHLCDGTNGTPDLRNRFIYGGDGTNNGATGGEATHTLTEAELPKITPSSTLKVWNSGTAVSENGGAVVWASTHGTDDLFSHFNSFGGNQPHNNMPPYYALAYIMKL